MPDVSDLPPVTDDHRRRAFVILALTGWTYELAMADQIKRRIIECCASRLRTMDWEQTQERVTYPVPRVKLGVDGHPIGWCTQIASRPMRPISQQTLL